MADRSREVLTGLFRDRESCEQAYGCVTARGYGKDDVSLLMSPDTRKRMFPKSEGDTELGTKAAEGAGIGALTGGGAGALLAGLAAAGIAVPGLPIIAAGPLAAALAGGVTGGAIGGILGALIGYGIPEERAKLYHKGIEEGGVVLGVTPRTPEDAEYLEREWRNLHGEQIYRPEFRP